MQSDLHATLENFLLEHLALELGNIRAGLAFLAPRSGCGAVADLGAARIDLQLSRLQDAARRMCRLLREDTEASSMAGEPQDPPQKILGSDIAFPPADELIFNRNWPPAVQDSDDSTRVAAISGSQVSQTSGGGRASFDHQIERLADTLCSTAAPMFRSRRVEGGKLL